MVQAEGVSTGRRVRRWRSVSEKRQIVQLTLERGASVAEVARAHGVNANQVFKWRRAFERGELVEACSALLPVSISHPTERAPEAGTEAPQVQEASSGAIHIELLGRAMISIESGADAVLVRSILESFSR
jgi:transposase